MKLLFDENLSPELAKMLPDIFPGSAHVHESGLGASDDRLIWDFAKENGFCIVSRDADFRIRAELDGAPPKVIWINVGNCTTRRIEELLRWQSAAIHTFEREPHEAILVLR